VAGKGGINLINEVCQGELKMRTIAQTVAAIDELDEPTQALGWFSGFRANLLEGGKRSGRLPSVPDLLVAH
jgi:hypothetical protein